MWYFAVVIVIWFVVVLSLGVHPCEICAFRVPFSPILSNISVDRTIHEAAAATLPPVLIFTINAILRIGEIGRRD